MVTDYLRQAGLDTYLDALRFNLVGYGCTTCIGNSGPLPASISQAIQQNDLVAVAVLSGNRNFEGRINPDVRANYLASPPLVVAYALAGTMDIDLASEPIGTDKSGHPVYLREIWPSQQEIQDVVLKSVHTEMFDEEYGEVFQGDEHWNSLPVPHGDLYEWDGDSTYVKNPPYFVGMPATPGPVAAVTKARVLAVLGDSITTDHISPAGSIKADGPAGRYLIAHGVPVSEFNSYGARRGNHEVMVRGTFANVRLRNRLAPGTEGGWTRHLPDGEVMSIFDASEKYQKEGVPLLVLAGKEYGSGSSRDWAAKGPKLLGIRAVVAESYERIHRSNLVGMGVLPLQFEPGQNVETLGLTGEELYTIESPAEGLAQRLVGHPALDRVDRVLRRLGASLPGDRPDRHAPGNSLLRERGNLAVCVTATVESIKWLKSGSEWRVASGEWIQVPRGSHAAAFRQKEKWQNGKMANDKWHTNAGLIRSYPAFAICHLPFAISPRKADAPAMRWASLSLHPPYSLLTTPHYSTPTPHSPLTHSTTRHSPLATPAHSDSA